MMRRLIGAGAAVLTLVACGPLDAVAGSGRDGQVGVYLTVITGAPHKYKSESRGPRRVQVRLRLTFRKPHGRVVLQHDEYARGTSTLHYRLLPGVYAIEAMHIPPLDGPERSCAVKPAMVSVRSDETSKVTVRCVLRG